MEEYFNMSEYTYSVFIFIFYMALTKIILRQGAFLNF